MALSAFSWQVAFTIGPAIGGACSARAARRSGSSPRRSASSAALARSRWSRAAAGPADSARRARQAATPAGVDAAPAPGMADQAYRGTSRDAVRPTTPSLPMPSLPRIRRQRPRAARPSSSPALSRASLELTAHGLTWVHLERPTPTSAAELAERFGWHQLDLEDVLSKRQRPKLDEYADYLFVVLHFPVYDKAIQRLNAAELDFFLGHDYLVTLPNVELLPGLAALRALRERRGAARRPLRQGLRLPALPRPRRPLRLLLPDPRQDRPQARRDRGRPVRGRAPRTSSATSRTSKQEIISYRKIIKPERPTLRVLERRTAALPARGARALLRRPRRRGRADLGPARQLQGGRRGARGHERVGHLAPPERRPADPDRLQRRPAAADADREHLRDERGLPGGDRQHSHAAFWIMVGASSPWSSGWSASSGASAGSDKSGSTRRLGRSFYPNLLPLVASRRGSSEDAAQRCPRAHH